MTDYQSIYKKLFDSIVKDKEEIYIFIKKEILKVIKYTNGLNFDNIKSEKDLESLISRPNDKTPFNFKINHDNPSIVILFKQVVEKCLFISLINKAAKIPLPWENYKFDELFENYQPESI